MLLSGHLILRNGVALDYPFEECIISALPILDELLILVEPTTDDTLDRVYALKNSSYPHIRVHHQRWWNEERKELALSDAVNYCIKRCRGKFHLQLQADEILHENERDNIRDACKEDNFDFAAIRRINFWKDFDTIVRENNLGNEVIRVARTELFPRIRSFGDAMHLYADDITGLRYCHIDASSYHYGCVRMLRPFIEKHKQLTALFHLPEDPSVLIAEQTLEPDWDTMIPPQNLSPFTGTHPAIMKEWIEKRKKR